MGLAIGAAKAQDKTYVMKISLPTLNDSVHQYAKNLAAAVEKETGGRIKGEVYPASQLGPIPRQIRGRSVRRDPVRDQSAGVLRRR